MDNNKFKFVVELPSKTVDPNGFYKKELVNQIMKKYTNLTVAGIDAPDVKRGIQHAGPGNLITFGTAKTHDVEWVERPNYAREKGYNPVFDLVKDWTKVLDRIDAFSKEKARMKEAELRARARFVTPAYVSGSSFYIGNDKVTVYDNFIKVGYTLVPRTRPVVKTVYYTAAEMEAINFLILNFR